MLKTVDRKQRGVSRRGRNREYSEVAFDVVETHHVPEVGLDHVGLLVGRRLLLLLPELLDERHRLPLEAARELPPDAAREQLHQLLVVHVQQLVEVDAAVRVLAESTLLLELSLKYCRVIS